MERRGPDGAGLWSSENVTLAHRRLAVLDTSQRGEQPMATPDGRYHLLYNGELYNDTELREELLTLGAAPGGFRGGCDAETVLWAFATWGAEAFERLRGMFAIAVYDTRHHVLHLARDPLGIKPLYYHLGSSEVTFASEPRALLAHPKIEALPDLPVVSGYLSTLRTSLGRRTLFRGVYALQPGERARFDAKSGEMTLETYYRPDPVDASLTDVAEAAELVREVLDDAVARHLRADVPLSALLSGGLDSTIICTSARERLGELHTWCTGDRSDKASDFEFARLASQDLGSRHNELALDRERFVRDWPWMIQNLGLPLSTPNEVAIHAVARDMRDSDFVVTLSGEGADEFFGGYELALQSAATFCDSRADKRSGGRFQLESAAWAAPSLKPHLVNADAWVGLGGDELLFEHYDELFRECEADAGDDASPIDAHLRFSRKSNLTGLLQRLDTSTMLASIEGRTPFADRRVAEVADRLPISLKWGTRGKTVLRNAWHGQIPAPINERSKQSFPLPFQEWSADLSWKLESSPFAKTFFADKARQEVAADTRTHWQLAWPMLNLAMWGDSWWA